MVTVLVPRLSKSLQSDEGYRVTVPLNGLEPRSFEGTNAADGNILVSTCRRVGSHTYIGPDIREPKGMQVLRGGLSRGTGDEVEL